MKDPINIYGRLGFIALLFSSLMGIAMMINWVVYFDTYSQLGDFEWFHSVATSVLSGKPLASFYLVDYPTIPNELYETLDQLAYDIWIYPPATLLVF